MPESIYWTLVNSHQAPLETRGVLCPSELQKYSAFRFPKRRNEWLLGRWTAKSLAQSIPDFENNSLDRIEIRNTPEGAPYLHLSGEATPGHCLTISHSDQSALCALTVGPDLRVGADLEKIEARTETFILDYFTPAERQIAETCPAETRASVVTLIWSAKEAMLKALGVGLRWDTRMVEVRGLDGILQVSENYGEWRKIEVGEPKASDRVWAAWWQRRDQFMLTLAAFATTQAEIRSVRLEEIRLENQR